MAAASAGGRSGSRGQAAAGGHTARGGEVGEAERRRAEEGGGAGPGPRAAAMAQCVQSVQEFIQDSFVPLVAALCSEEAERLTRKNNLSFAELVKPFCRLTSEGRCRERSRDQGLFTRGGGGGGPPFRPGRAGVPPGLPQRRREARPPFPGPWRWPLGRVLPGAVTGSAEGPV